MRTPILMSMTLAILTLFMSGCKSDDEVVVALRGDEKLSAGERVPFLLGQNYPEPFDSRTMIPFDVASSTHMTLKVYTEDWREITTLIDEVCGAGTYHCAFGVPNLASGVYYYVLEGGGVKQIRSMRLAK